MTPYDRIFHDIDCCMKKKSLATEMRDVGENEKYDERLALPSPFFLVVSSMYERPCRSVGR